MDEFTKKRRSSEERDQLLEGIAVAQALTMVLIGISHWRLSRKLRKIDLSQIIVIAGEKE